MRKMNRMTEVVLMASRNYPKALQAATAYIGNIPYGVQQVDRRTVDRRLERMTIEEASQFAASDPSGTVARRLDTLDARAAALPPTDEIGE